MQKQCAPSLIRSASLRRRTARVARPPKHRCMRIVCWRPCASIGSACSFYFGKMSLSQQRRATNALSVLQKFYQQKKHVHATTYIIFVTHYHSQHSCSNSDGGCQLASLCLVFKHCFMSSAACGGHVSRAGFRGRQGHAETRHFWFGE